MYLEKLLHRDVFTQDNFFMHKLVLSWVSEGSC